jgi:hypothetical protein
MTILARDAVASDHLVYAWPFQIAPECEVACAEDEQVVMCPAWLVGERLGPGRHRWRTPDPSRPIGAFFVLTAPVVVSFDMVTGFLVPATGQPVRLRASGSLQVRCADPGLLIAQFVGLPFDRINDGVLRSVSRSVERMLARLLTRRVVMSGTPLAVTDPSMLQGVVEELVAYNPTAGAVFGVELLRMGHLVVVADDGSTPYLALPVTEQTWHQPNGHDHVERAKSPTMPPPMAAQRQRGPHYQRAVTPVLETIRGMPAVEPPPDEVAVSGEIVARGSTPTIQSETVPPAAPASTGAPVGVISGEIGSSRSASETETQPMHALKLPRAKPVGAVASEPAPASPAPTPSTDNPVSAVSGEIGGAKPLSPAPADARGSVGATPVRGEVAGEIRPKISPGQRVLVPGPNGLMQSATVRQLLQGYYELEVGSSGETIWVPVAGVIPEQI